MKLNFYSYLVFGLIVVILYPLIFYHSDKRIKMSNSNNITYKYSIRGYLSLDNVVKLSSDALRQTKIINSKYFKNKEILKFKPEKGISVSEVIYWDTNKKSKEIIPTNNLVVIKNNDIILFLGDEIIFYYDLNNLFNFLKEELTNSKYLKKEINNDCYINQNLISMRKINYSLYEFNFDISQKIYSFDEKIKNQDEIISTYKNCLINKLNKLGNYFTEHLENYQKFQINDFKDDFDNFLNNQNNLLFDQKQIKNVKESVLKLKDKILTNLINIDLDLKFAQPLEFEVAKKYNKNFNMYVVSFILSILFALIIFYVLFFLKKQIKILKKIF